LSPSLTLAHAASAALAAIVLFLVLVGHGFIWVVLVNRLHAVLIPRWLCKGLTVVFFALAAGIPLATAWELRNPGIKWLSFPDLFQAHLHVGVYGGVCLVTGAWAVAKWSWRRMSKPAPGIERYCRARAPVLLESSLEAGPADEHSFLAPYSSSAISTSPAGSASRTSSSWSGA